jgi:ribosomal protein S18 acetylase RimI-like enzyme
MATPNIEIRRATLADLSLIVPLFAAYRQFYRMSGNSDEASQFLQERLEQNQSIIFLALATAEAVGFTQLYPSFSSTALAPIFILNDLFVAPGARRLGAGTALLQAAAEYGRSVGGIRLTLRTEVTNTTAQSVYEKAGWERNDLFYAYDLKL